MGLDTLNAGRDIPSEINVVIEIPKDSDPVKYRVGKSSNVMFVDYVLSTPMRYPCNYGVVPRTRTREGDPLEALIILPLPLVAGTVCRSRPVGLLKMEDERGEDDKLVVIPSPEIFPAYTHIENIGQVSAHWLERIGHFFEHYRDLEPSKWLKIKDWTSVDEAHQAIVEAVQLYKVTVGD